MATLDGNSDFSDYSLKLNLFKFYVCFIVRGAREGSMVASLHYKLINVYWTDNLKALHTEFLIKQTEQSSRIQQTGTLTEKGRFSLPLSFSIPPFNCLNLTLLTDINLNSPKNSLLPIDRYSYQLLESTIVHVSTRPGQQAATAL